MQYEKKSINSTFNNLILLITFFVIGYLILVSIVEAKCWGKKSEDKHSVLLIC